MDRLFVLEDFYFLGNGDVVDGQEYGADVNIGVAALNAVTGLVLYTVFEFGLFGS